MIVSQTLLPHVVHMVCVGFSGLKADSQKDMVIFLGMGGALQPVIY